MLKGVHAGVDVTSEMLLNHAVGVGQVFAIRSTSIHPPAPNSWTPSVFAGLLVFPPKSVDVLAPGEERFEQGDLLLRRGMTVDGDRRPR
jgi:hypothetical protein